MLQCPWCHAWAPLESFTVLQIPPDHPQQCTPIYKHGGEAGCKSLFALSER